MNTKSFDKIELSSYLLVVVALIGILKLNFLPLIFSIILTYLIIDYVNQFVIKQKIKWQQKHSDEEQHKETKQWLAILTTTILTLMLGGIITGLVIFSYNFFKVDNINVMTNKFIDILETLKDNPNMPKFIIDYIPADLVYLKQQALDLLKNHLSDIGRISKATITGFVYIIIGFIVGAMLSFHNLKRNIIDDNSNEERGPLVHYLLMRIKGFKRNFENVFVAQMKISFVNAILTGIYLLIVLPLFNIDIPFKYLLVFITFIVGLIPVIGNLISNTLIIVFSFSISLGVAIASLIFLVVIHKLEYFLNAKIIGNEINATSWELLLAMLVFEHLFGIGGVIVAPIYYAYLKHELQFKKLI